MAPGRYPRPGATACVHAVADHVLRQGNSRWGLRGHLAGTGAGLTQRAGVGRSVPARPLRSAGPTRLMRACRPDAAPVPPGAGVPAAYEHRGRDGVHAILDPLPGLPLIGPMAVGAWPPKARPEGLTAAASWAATAGSARGPPPPPAAEHPAARSVSAPSSAPASRDTARACALVMAASWRRSGGIHMTRRRRGRFHPRRRHRHRPRRGRLRRGGRDEFVRGGIGIEFPGGDPGGQFVKPGVAGQPAHPLA